MSSQTVPTIRRLEREEIESLLSRHHIGRLAYSFRDRVDIEPIHYVYEKGWIYGRTSPGVKLTTVQHNPWVAFEVDEVDSVFEWRSAVVHGTLYVLSGRHAAVDDAVIREAEALLRRIVPSAFRPDDPTPERFVIIRIAVQELSGRASTLKGR
jgi:nitroimidazol reductase NimA-like FMN-containing flavoprotein (pyridoxamine 5'-phosphate oxidase superfamily)